MKILMLTPYLPYPLFSGGQIRTYNLLKNLSRKHQITLFSFIRDEKEREFIPELLKFCQEVKVFLKRPPWSLTSLALSAVSVYPLVVCLYLKKQLKDEIKEATGKKQFDLIHAETFYVMPNIPENNIPTILVEQTIEYLVYKHYTRSVKFLPLKWLMQFDVFKIRFWEKKFWQKATRVVAMSDMDRRQMQRLVPGLIVDLVPNGVDDRFFLEKKSLTKKSGWTVLFVGNFKWLQNREAVSILVRDIWPVIKDKLKNVKLWIVGRSPTKEILDFTCSSIKVSQDIDDIRKAYTESDVLLAPIYGPGGTRYKILESMAQGLPVVSTPTGIEGLGIRHGQQALISDNPLKLASGTVKVLTDRALYQKLVRNGRKLVSEKFNWKTIASSLDRIYKQAVYEEKD